MDKFADLELSLHPRGADGYAVELRFSQPGDDADIRLIRDGSSPVTFDFELLRGLQNDDTAYGQALAERLFADPALLSACEKARDTAQTLNAALRLRFCINAPELHDLRWETLRHPTDGAPFCTDELVVFSRYLSSLDWRPVRASPPGDLRALVVIANPTNLDKDRLAPIDVAGELRRAEASLGAIAVTALASGGSATLGNVITHVREGYDVLYLVAHGTLRDREPWLLLEDEAGALAPVKGAELVVRLKQLQQRPRLVVLASCQSAGTDYDGGVLAALGPRLAEIGIPAVLAMQGSIAIATVEQFMPRFFKELQADGQIDRAIAVARGLVRDRDDWWMPVLFMRLKSGRLWESGGAATRKPSDAEIAKGLDRLGPLLAERAPVLSAALATQAEILRRAPAEPQSQDQQRARADALAEVDRMCEEALDIGFAELALGAEPPKIDLRRPFRGLESFRVEDQPFFFGREALTEHLLGRLASHPFLAVLGPSGSGKSSVVLAGLVPALQAREPGLALASFKPGSDPLAQLDAALANLAQPYLLLADQFEEVFTLCADTVRRQAFFDRLLAIAKSQRVIVTMRADFWGDCAPYPELRAAMQAHQELIAPMDAAELRQAIERQAAAVGLRFEADLVGTILDDVRGEPGAMPLLQHILLQLWERRHGRWLRVGEYQALGGVQQAIGRTADAVYEQLSPDQREQMRTIFVRLTRVDEEGALGGEQRDTRRRVAWEELAPADSQGGVDVLVPMLAGARLVITSTNAVTGRREVEVVHEALIRSWSRLRAWLDEDRAVLRMRETVRRAAQEWQEHERDESYLAHRGRRLDELKTLADHPRVTLNDLERAYLDACRARDLQQRRLRIAARIDYTPGASDSIPSMLKVVLSLPGQSDELQRINAYQVADSIAVEIDRNALGAVEHDGAAYGQRLSEYFFANMQAREIFIRALADTHESATPLRIQWQIDANAADIQALAWETLCGPEDNAPLLANSRIYSSRIIGGASLRLRSMRKLRALVAGAGSGQPGAEAPDGQAPAAELGDIPQTTLAPGGISLDNLLAQLREGYDILYLACRGELSDGEVWLWLDDATGAATRVFGQQLLSQMCELQSKLRLVVLASQPAADALAGGDRGWLSSLGRQIVQDGVTAALLLPAALTPETRAQFLAALFGDVQSDGQIDRAVAVARAAVRERPDWWMPVLLSGSERCALWYAPGFGDDRKGFERWPALVRSISHGRVTPFLGPGLVEPYFGARSEIALRWAETYGFAGRSSGKADLAQVAEYLAVNQDQGFPRVELVEYLRNEALRRYGDRLPEAARAAPLPELLTAISAEQRARDPNDVHTLLAQLPVPIYVTINQDPLLAEALRATGKQPVVELCRWNEDIETLPSSYDDEPDYRPTPQRPLVFHLFGHLADPDSLVITEGDYFDFLIGVAANKELIPTVVRQAVADTALCYIGQEVDDRSFDFLFRSLASLPGKSRRRPRYSHLLQCEPQQRDHTQRYLEARYQADDISIYWGGTDDFVLELQRRIGEAAKDM
jgi:hypothetical protein